MNLPPDKLKLLSQCDNEKKWELVCDEVRRHTDSPESLKTTVQQERYGLSVRVPAVDE